MSEEEKANLEEVKDLATRAMCLALALQSGSIYDSQKPMVQDELVKALQAIYCHLL